MPARGSRPTMGLRGGSLGCGMPCPQSLSIQNEEELDHHIEEASTSGNWTAYSSMRAYIREAHAMQKEMRSLVQNTALVKWKTPSWVPLEARPFVKANDPNVLAGVNMPRLADLPEEWAHWLWRYPKEASSRPGVRRTAQGVNLSSVRGLLLVMGHAPCRNGFICVRTVFFMRAAQLIAMLGLYRCLVDELRLTIAVVPGLTSAQPVDNVTVEDMARLFARDGVTIPQIGDAYEWGHTALITWSQGMDAARRTEAMSALQVAR